MPLCYKIVIWMAYLPVLSISLMAVCTCLPESDYEIGECSHAWLICAVAGGFFVEFGAARKLDWSNTSTGIKRSYPRTHPSTSVYSHTTYDSNTHTDIECKQRFTICGSIGLLLHHRPHHRQQRRHHSL